MVGLQFLAAFCEAPYFIVSHFSAHVGPYYTYFVDQTTVAYTYNRPTYGRTVAYRTRQSAPLTRCSPLSASLKLNSG